MKNLINTFGIILTVFIFSSCKEKPLPPVLSTASVSEITTTSAVSGGNVSDNGGAAIISRGVCWNTSDNPVITNNKTSDNEGSGSFTSNLTQLTPNTVYFIRAYATNSAGTSYGSSISFKTIGDKPASNAQNASNIQLTTATLNGSVNPNYLSTSVVFEWGTTTSYGNSISPMQGTLDGHETIELASGITGLNPGTTYHYRITATNISGTTNSSDMTFSTNIADIDNNSYRTITIGNQLWMAENIRSTKYNDGTPIPLVEDGDQWKSASAVAYCFYNNEPGNKNLFGALYNWFAVDQSQNGRKNVCPSGWHVPKKSEWIILFTFLSQNGYGFGGNNQAIAKSLASTSGWDTGYSAGVVGNDQATNNTSGFNGLPCGLRSYDGTFSVFGRWGGWWAQPDDYMQGYNLWYNVITQDNSVVTTLGLGLTYGSSIRCLKN